MQLTTVTVGIASLAGLAAAAAHPRHQKLHEKRDVVTVTDVALTTEVETDVVVVTVDAEAPAPSTVIASTTAVASVQPISAAPAASTPTTSEQPTTFWTHRSKSHYQQSSSTSVVSVPASTVAPVSETAQPTTTTVVLSSVASSSAAASATSSATSTSTSTSSSSGKRGLAYNEASLTSAFEGSSEISWAYNWGSSTSDLSSDFEYVPMLWGLDSSATSDWAAAASSAIAAGSSHLLSFNEPDLSTQSNIDYTTAAEGYMTYMEPFAGQAKLGGPAVTNGAAPMGLTYLENFISACTDCTIDFIPIHWYDSATNYDYFKTYVEEAYIAGGNRSIWITEFAATGTADEQVTFLENVMSWLDNTDYVERYAYFMCEDGVLLSSDTTLSDIGTTFSTYTTAQISSVMESA